MSKELIQEYIEAADKLQKRKVLSDKSVRQWNRIMDRMRTIVEEVASKGPESIKEFLVVLEKKPASVSAAYHLVELARVP